jgi:uncharacterized heparinase superfamily protein
MLPDVTVVASAARQRMRHAGAALIHAVRPFGHRLPKRLIIAPQDLRTTDPTIAADIYAGQIKFAGKLLNTHGGSPFQAQAPSAAFAAELNGFSWLRHLRAAETALARTNARALVTDWMTVNRRGASGVAARPDVVTRRMMSWLSNTPMLLEGVDRPFYQAFLKALAGDARRLNQLASAAPPTEERLMIEIALMHYALSCLESDKELKSAAERLCDELDYQILPDGAHISRNPNVLLMVLLDLLPLKVAFLWRKLQTPQPIISAIDRMMPMLRMMRHADGGIALFNGMGPTRTDVLAAILAQDDTMAPPLLNAPYGGYQRVEAGDSVLLIDCAAAPKPPLAGRAHAAPAAFEFSSDNHRIIVNCGNPPEHRADMRSFARVTAAHSTLTVAEDSIGRITGTEGSGNRGAQFSGGARKVTLTRADNPSGTLVTVSHDGYAKPYGVVHERQLALSASGGILGGEDKLTTVKDRGPQPFVLRFHLHPQVKATLRSDGEGVYLALPGKMIWLFEAPGHKVGLEESILFASTDGLRRTDQIVIAGDSKTTPSIKWIIRRARDQQT